MLKSILKKVAWVGRATVFMVGLTVVLAVVLGVATTALAATGGNFLLGKANTAVSYLTANVAGPALRIINNSTASTATALNLSVASGRPPLTVNPSAGKATNLNADKVDGESFTCPAGTLLHEGVCIETTKHTAATFSNAESVCLSERRRLPTVAELQTFRNRAGQDFTNIEWGSENFANGTNDYAHFVDPDSGQDAFVLASNSFAYRCVQATHP